MQCELCEREVEHVTVHHLIPRQKDGRFGPRADLCSACHRQIHILFDNTRLARELNCLDRLRDEPDMQRFLAWVKRQPPDRRVKVRGRRK
ncbi:MAG TPA: HNH endonuclease [Thermoanaerobaculia bacterium]|nr:HNH endonuclease [Thermoanaerobaculia bacterium]